MNSTQQTVLVSSSSVPSAEGAPVREVLTTPLEVLLIVWFTAPLGFMFVAWIVFSIKQLFPRCSAPSAHTYLITKPMESPCSSCRFFSHNAYLKCAVHPSIALTQKAANCSNFWALDDDKFAQ